MAVASQSTKSIVQPSWLIPVKFALRSRYQTIDSKICDRRSSSLSWYNGLACDFIYAAFGVSEFPRRAREVSQSNKFWLKSPPASLCSTTGDIIITCCCCSSSQTMPTGHLSKISLPNVSVAHKHYVPVNCHRALFGSIYCAFGSPRRNDYEGAA